MCHHESNELTFCMRKMLAQFFLFVASSIYHIRTFYDKIASSELQDYEIWAFNITLCFEEAIPRLPVCMENKEPVNSLLTLIVS